MRSQRWTASLLRRGSGSPRPSPRPRPRRSAPGKASTRASTCWSWRRPARARRSPRSCRASTGCCTPPAGPRRTQAGHPRAVRVAAQGARRRRRAQPPLPPRRHHPGRGPARRVVPRRHRRGSLRRHPPAGASPAGLAPARHPHHHAGVAVPDADVGGARVAARRRHRHRRRDPRRRRHQARRAPRPLARAPRRPCSSSRPAASGSAPPCGRTTRWPASSADARRCASWRRRASRSWCSTSPCRSTT